MAETSIEWTDATWNPVAGCTVLTSGCTNCYAMRMAARLEAMGTEKYQGSPERAAAVQSGLGKSS
jgi:protein gp37